MQLCNSIDIYGNKRNAFRGRSPGPTRREKIVRTRALIACMATRDLSIPDSNGARRLNVDRSAVSRAAQRVRHDAEFMAAAQADRGLL
jgi:hypothetical protein